MDEMSGSESLLRGKKTVYEMANKQSDIRHRKLAFKMQNEGTYYLSSSIVYRLSKELGLFKERETEREESVPDS